MTNFLQTLNSAQRQAVETLDGPLLVLAGAGTGKTRVLTTRFAFILLSGKAKLTQILAVTFTNKAAREMRERIESILGYSAEGLWLGTFHSLCTRMLRRHAHIVGLEHNFIILNGDDQLRFLKQIMSELRIDTKHWQVSTLLGIIQRWKDRGFMPADITPSENTDYADGKAVKAYQSYQDRLIHINACDFGDLMLHMVVIFRKHPDVLADYHHLFRYILVDEYQDTNTVQYLWLKLLAHRANTPANICCVGDDDQSIYSWRGANIENILRFEKDFPGAKIIRLENNYRSTAPILAAASGLISHNRDRLGKTLHPGNNEAEGDKVQITALGDSVQEARILSSQVEALINKGKKLNEMAILVRAGFQTRAFEERFLTIGLPYRIIGGVRFYERQEIRDAIAYFRCVMLSSDDLAFERIINLPRRGIGDNSLALLHQSARASNISLMQAAADQLQQGTQLRGKARNNLSELLNLFHEARNQLKTKSPTIVAKWLLEASGYITMWQNSKIPDAPGRLENLKELIQALNDFENMQEFLEHVSLVIDNDELQNEDKINIMTLHAAKGLEFDTVFLPGWEEGLFPSQRTLDENGIAGLEEERRLAYVGITRARKHVFISHTANRMTYGSWQYAVPSRFIEEIPIEYVDIVPSSGAKRYVDRGYFSRRNSSKIGIRPKIADDIHLSGNRMTYVESNTDDSSPASLHLGSRIFHQKFGYGTIQSIEGNKLNIDFDKAGLKRIISSFVISVDKMK